jgi:hypothetical protein
MIADEHVKIRAHWLVFMSFRFLFLRAGIALLMVCAIRLLTTLLPLRLLAPEWYLGMARELANLSPVLITAVSVLVGMRFMTQRLNPEDFTYWWREQLLMRGLVLLFVLVIPVQLGASVVFDWRVGEAHARQLSAVREQLALSSKQPPSTLQRLQARQLRDLEGALLRQQEGSRQRRFGLVLEALKVCGIAAAMIWLCVGILRTWQS